MKTLLFNPNGKAMSPFARSPVGPFARVPGRSFEEAEPGEPVARYTEIQDPGFRISLATI